jgi:hypothetical protein
MKQRMLLGGGALAMAAYASAAPPPPPVATYWMDAATQSGLGAGMGAGMTPGARPTMSQIMGMMSGQSSVSRTLELRLASKQKPSGAPQADHLIPPGLAMGPSLPLITPAAAAPVKSTPGLPPGFQQPRGRMLVYWGCGEHVGPNQPTVIDLANLASGQPAKAMAAIAVMGRAAVPPQAGLSAGFGQWPNAKDSRAVPAGGSLVGAHKVAANYSPPIAFALGAGQDFMPDLGLAEAGALPSGAVRLTWRAAPTASGYAVGLFGANLAGDVIVWTSARTAAAGPNFDYLPPSEVKTMIAAGAALPPGTTECLLPAEVAKASPMGMVTMIGYGPEVHFAEDPKAPQWTAKVRFKTSASLMRGMGAMGGMGGASAQPGQPTQPPKKRKKFGLGDVLKGVVPVPDPE